MIAQIIQQANAPADAPLLTEDAAILLPFGWSTSLCVGCRRIADAGEIVLVSRITTTQRYAQVPYAGSELQKRIGSGGGEERNMPLVLMQRAWRDDPKYKDTEFSVYHYPQQYFNFVHGGEKFVYYRPSRGASVDEASTYFGCGELGDWWTDPQDETHRFVGIRRPIRFATPVRHVDAREQMFESRFQDRSAFQGHSVRAIDDIDYYRILNAAGLTGAAWSEAPTVDDVMSGLTLLPTNLSPPRDAFRELVEVPDGTGYRPTGRAIDVVESAALQERARGDHQDTLKRVKAMADARGARCLFNNNVDLLVEFGENKLLVEAKSLNVKTAAVDRMRYGMGQLFDYGVRYRAEIGRAQPVLAFGAVPSHDVAWISTILQDNGIAFIARDRAGIIPLNTAAKTLPLFV